MHLFFRSLRFKLVAMFVAVFGLIQVTLGVAGLVARERSVRHQFDEELIECARVMAVQLLQLDEPLDQPALTPLAERAIRSVHLRDFYIQLRDLHGQPLARSENLGVYQLPMTRQQAWASRTGSSVVQTLRGEAVERVLGPQRQLRMVTLSVETAGREPFYLQVATSLTHVQESVVFLRWLLLIVIAAGFVTAAIASWLVMGRAIHRINRVAQLAHKLSPRQLTQRLDPPQAHDEVGEMVEELNEMLDRLEDGFRSQQRFIADASHELKTPVSVLLSQAQVLRLAGGSQQEHKAFVASVEEEMQRLGTLIESLLTFTRADEASTLIESKLADLNEVAVMALRHCNPLARREQVSLRLSLPEDDPSEPMTCHGDADLLEVMLSNLVRNAIRFSPTDDVVDVTMGRDGGMATCIVCDHGPGIPPDQIDTVFNRFTQGSNSGPGTGCGLGLTIAQRIAELHGGTIRAACPTSGGCRFEVSLPLLVRSDASQKAEIK